MTLPIFVDISSLDRFTATTTTVSHLDLVPPRLDEEEWLRGRPSTSVSEELSMTFSPGRSGVLDFLLPAAKHQEVKISAKSVLRQLCKVVIIFNQIYFI